VKKRFFLRIRRGRQAEELATIKLNIGNLLFKKHVE
jgi:hypothetical protein